MRHCFYHTDLGQNAVFYNFATLEFCNTAILHSFNIQDDQSMPGLLAKPLKSFQNHLYGQLPLTFAVQAVAECLNEH